MAAISEFVKHVLLNDKNNVEKILSSYQVEFVKELLDGKFCLYCEPGTGKTFPSLVTAKEYQYLQGGTSPILITAPAYLVPNWENEIKRLYPDATIERADGSGFAKRSLAFDGDVDFVITSYANWSAKSKGSNLPLYRQLVERKWAAYIFDEAHRLRGHDSQATKHVFKIRLSKSVNKNTPLILLTGTPFCRDGGDYFVYFKLWNSKEYSSYWRFVDEWCVVNQTPWSKDVGNIRRDKRDQFASLTDQFAIKARVKDIPELQNLQYIEEDHYVEMPPSVVAMIRKAKKEYIIEHSDLPSIEYVSGSGALYTRQRQLATCPPTKEKPKIDWLKDFLVDHPQKVACYVWYKDSAEAVSQAITDRPVFLATGDLTPVKRVAMVDAWKASEGGLLVATIPSLCEGVSLTESHELVFLEHSPLPSDQEQVIKRLCRRGQENVVNVYHVRARNTVDMVTERVLKNRYIGLEGALMAWIEEE